MCARGAGLRGGVVLLRAFCVPAGMSCVRSRRSCGSTGLFCARSRRSCVPVEMSCVRLMPVVRFYWDVLCSITPIIRSYRDVLCSITPAVCRIAPNRTACDMFRSYYAVGRDRHSCVLNGRAVIGLGGFISGLCVSLGRSRQRTKGRGNAGDAENGVGGAVECVFA